MAAAATLAGFIASRFWAAGASGLAVGSPPETHGACRGPFMSSVDTPAEKVFTFM
jgi:hypothetical protein